MSIKDLTAVLVAIGMVLIITLIALLNMQSASFSTGLWISIEQ